MYPISTPFEWDSYKAVANFRKHGISFVEAMGAFYDPYGLYGLDREHSTDTEEREYCIGQTDRGILMVIFTERHREEIGVRIISARRAHKKEEQHYYETQA